jgi:hypothetical protein
MSRVSGTQRLVDDDPKDTGRECHRAGSRRRRDGGRCAFLLAAQAVDAELESASPTAARTTSDRERRSAVGVDGLKDDGVDIRAEPWEPSKGRCFAYTQYK